MNSEKYSIMYVWIQILKRNGYCMRLQHFFLALLCYWLNVDKKVISQYTTFKINKVSIINSLLYRKVENSTQVYYSILDSFGQRSQYISINFPPHKHSLGVLLIETIYGSQLWDIFFPRVRLQNMDKVSKYCSLFGWGGFFMSWHDKKIYL